MGATVAAKNRKVRQDALREMLSKKCTVEQVLKNVKKMEDQGAQMEAIELQALRAATDTRVRLLAKYIPDLKQTELEISGSIELEAYELNETERSARIASLLNTAGSRRDEQADNGECTDMDTTGGSTD